MLRVGKTMFGRITWHDINAPGPHLPDDEIEVLVYDSFLDETVIGFIEPDEDDRNDWINTNTQLPLTHPAWWAEMPYPEIA